MSPHHPPDLLRILHRCRIIHHHAEVRPPVHLKRRIFEGKQPEQRVLDVLGALAVAAHVVVAPHGQEFRALAAEFVDQRFDLLCSPRAGGIHPEGGDDEAGDTFPVVLGGAHARVEEDEAQHIALLRRQRAVICEQHGRRTIPGDYIPDGVADQRRTRIQRIKHALQARRYAFLPAIAYLRRPTETDEEEMLALDIGQHQRSRNPVEHVGGRRTAAALLQPGIPGGADIGAARHLLAAQTRRAPPLPGETQGGGIELCAAALEIGAQPVFGGHEFAHPISHYTMIRSLLYHDSSLADICLQPIRRYRHAHIRHRS
ncbi:hypothetical protein RHECNPAF_4310030 [Rhizobium etli CNPAF512]|nr:hypothetical protein RHECNPAF_4310030 [Rhizobium etli CNPAF512]